MKFFSTITFSALLLFTGCTHIDPPKKSIVIVLCDTSNSITGSDANKSFKNRMDGLKDIVRRLPTLYPYGSRFFYYPISNNRLSDCLVPEISYMAKTKSKIDSDKIRIAALQELLAARLDSIAPLTYNSCIISSIKEAIDRLQQLSNIPNGKEYNYQLVIISDMLEDCKRTNGSHIEMRPNDTAKFNKAITDLGNEALNLDTKNPAFTVWIMLTSPDVDDRIDIIKQSWRNCFSRTGLDSSRLQITEGIPQTQAIKINL